ncbi:MAG: hypothetical protein NTU49_00370 [Gammaproteobacteria bacterium]|nr:hypothetical protein [Gammaproteobacteria bacterium]
MRNFNLELVLTEMGMNKSDRDALLAARIPLEFHEQFVEYIKANPLIAIYVCQAIIHGTPFEKILQLTELQKNALKTYGKDGLWISHFSDIADDAKENHCKALIKILDTKLFNVSQVILFLQNNDPGKILEVMALTEQYVTQYNAREADNRIKINEVIKLERELCQLADSATAPMLLTLLASCTHCSDWLVGSILENQCVDANALYVIVTKINNNQMHFLSAILNHPACVDELKVIIAVHPMLDKNALHKLISTGSDRIFHLLLRDKNCTPVIKELINEAMAKNQNTSSIELQRIAKETKKPEILSIIVKHQSCDDEIRKTAAMNNAISDNDFQEILEGFPHLQNDSDIIVKCNYFIDNKHYSVDIFSLIKSLTSPFLLARIAGSTHFGSSVLQNPHCDSRALLNIASRATRAEVLSEVLQHSGCTDEIRFALAKNKTTDIKDLSKIISVLKTSSPHLIDELVSDSRCREIISPKYGVESVDTSPPPVTAPSVPRPWNIPSALFHELPKPKLPTVQESELTKLISDIDTKILKLTRKNKTALTKILEYTTSGDELHLHKLKVLVAAKKLLTSLSDVPVSFDANLKKYTDEKTHSARYAEERYSDTGPLIERVDKLLGISNTPTMGLK